MQLENINWQVMASQNAPGIQTGNVLHFSESGNAYQVTVNNQSSPWTDDCTIVDDTGAPIKLQGTCAGSRTFILKYTASNPAELVCEIESEVEVNSSPLAGLVALWIGGSFLGMSTGTALFWFGLALLLLLLLKAWWNAGGSGSSATWMALDTGPIRGGS